MVFDDRVKDENAYSPPLEGCRGGLPRTGRTHPEGCRLLPLPRGGVSREVCDLSLAFLKRCDLYYGVFHHKQI